MENALKIFNQMILNGIKPNVIVYNCMIDGFTKQGDMQNAMEMFNQMNKRSTFASHNLFFFF